MKTTLRNSASAAGVCFAVLFFVCCTSAAGQGTAFSYQGRLNVAGAAANGSYDIAFTLFTTNIGGTAIAGPVTNTAVGVTNGLFMTIVDFGDVFAGGSNWLELAVSTNGANAFSTLSPRQQLTPVPYAITAGNVSGTIGSASLTGTYGNAVTLNNPNNVFTGNGAGLTSINATNLVGSVTSNQFAPDIGLWARSGSNVFYNAGNVGIGTSSPSAELEVGRADAGVTAIFARGADANFNVNMFQSNLDNSGFAVVGGMGLNYGSSIYNAAVRFHRGFSSIGGFISFTTGTNAERVRIDYNGNVGIGTMYPGATLDTVGTVIGGGPGNGIAQGIVASTIAGGGYPGYPNVIEAESSFIGAGNLNTISSNLNNSFIGAGYNNDIASLASFIGSGNLNNIQANSASSFIGAGIGNAVQTNSSGSFIGGGSGNIIETGAGSSVISGGVANDIQPGADLSAIGGGYNNQIGTNANFSVLAGGNANVMRTGSYYSFLGGGDFNNIGMNAPSSVLGGGAGNSIGDNSFMGTIGGGNNNIIQSNSSQQVIAGGMYNTIESRSWASAIGGGGWNIAQGYGATVPGGWSNSATADFTFAGGLEAQATNAGSFVWADDEGTPFASTAGNQFLIRAAGGVGIGTAAPQAPLDVFGGNAYPQLRVSVPADSPYGSFLSLDASATSGGKNYFVFSTGNGAGEGQGKLVFKNQSDGLEILTLAPGGNVGIGVSDPQSALQVNGTVTASAFVGDGTGLSLGATNSFTPTIGDGATDFNTTIQSGYYAKMGNLVYFEVWLFWSGKNSAAPGNNLAISLPFAVASSRAVFNVGYMNGITNSTQLVALGASPASQMNLYGLSTTGGSSTAVKVASCGDNGELQITGTYRWQ